MALIHRAELTDALKRLGELAQSEGIEVDLLVVGGGAMVLGFDARPSTRDLDAVILMPRDRSKIWGLIETVAQERGWPKDWLNEGAKGFLVGLDTTVTLLSFPGISVRRPNAELLLAMKLCAWRDDLDIGDARRLLAELPGDRETVWNRVARHLQPGRELKAQFAFEDLWSTDRESP